MTITCFAVLMLGVAGCEALSGLDHLEVSDCAVSCDSGAPGEGGADALVEADGIDAIDPIDAVDEIGDSTADPADHTCGPLDTINDCGDCGVTCDQATCTSAGCSGATCVYQCDPGRADCNAATPPDTDGCECATPGCCGSSCETTHADALGQAFYDCVAPGTYNETQAQEACAAFTKQPSQCALLTCIGAGVGDLAVCSTTSPTACACWTYTGPNAGRAFNSGVAGVTGCKCAGATSPAWN